MKLVLVRQSRVEKSGKIYKQDSGEITIRILIMNVSLLDKSLEI